MIKETHIIMGMPITIMSPDPNATPSLLQKTFRFFEYVDQKYSPFITTSDVSKINQGLLGEKQYDAELKEILDVATKTTHETNGYFNVWHDGTFDPSGIVKGWAIQEAAKILKEATNDFYLEAGGDIQVGGVNDQQKPWRIGIRNPFNRDEIVSVIILGNYAVATSGTAVRGQHIYNPHSSKPTLDITSISVIAPRILDADRMATAAFAMGKQAIHFIESLKGYEGYMIDNHKEATMTTGWKKFEVHTS